MKIKIITLGCPKNEVDSEYLAGSLTQAGYVLVEKIEQAEAVLVNTCGFIQSAKEESLDVILELAELKKQGKIKKLWAAGCLISRYQKELAIELPEVDVFLPLAAYKEITEVIKGSQSAESARQPKRTLLAAKPYAYLKISEGCQNKCSYCAIPLIRGPLQSRSETDILKEAEQLAEAGIKELIILGQDTTSYGLDIYPESRLVSLLKKLKTLNIFPWLRLMYAHPAHTTEELIDLLAAGDSLLPYLDIPLQHINDRILKKMNRHIEKEQLVDLIAKLRERIPGLALRTTFIVGFPGETEAEFQELLDFIKETRFERLGVFTYSPEEGTPAYKMRPQINDEIKQERWHQIMRQQQKIAKNYQASWLGKTIEVLIEARNTNNRYQGRGYMDAPEVDGEIIVKGKSLKLGEIIPVKVTAASDYDLEGEALA